MNTIEKKHTQNKRYIDGPAGLLQVDDGGKGGTPVVFLHSFGGSLAHWQPQLEHLRNECRAVAFDLRGHGQSAAPADNNYEVEAMAADLDAVADTLKIRRFVLVGHSMGGSVAINYAWMHPERVAGLVAVGTPGKTMPEQAQSVIASLESDKYEQVMESYMQKLLVHARPGTERLAREGMSRLSREATLRIIEAAFKYDPIPALHSYKGPRLIISPAGDPPEQSLSAQMPGIPHVTVEGTSHWMQMDKPEEFNRLLDGFLETVTSSHPS